MVYGSLSDTHRSYIEEALEQLADLGFFVKLLRLGAVERWEAILYQGADSLHPWGHLARAIVLKKPVRVL